MIRAHWMATIGYLALVLMLGGASAAGFGANLVLQLLGAMLVAWSIHLDMPRFGWFAIAVAILALVQFVPLPPGWWNALPGRESVAQGFDLLGMLRPWLTVSLAPWHSLASLSWWIPALALFCAVRVHGTPLVRPVTRVAAIVAVVSIALGLAQSVRGIGYLYAVTNYGRATGFFANSNHQSLFLLIVSILCVADAFRGRSAAEVLRFRTVASWQLLLVPLCLGTIAFNDTLAVIMLLVPVTCALFLIIRPGKRHGSIGWVLAAALLLVLAALLGVALDIFPNDLFGHPLVPGIGRQTFWSTTLAMIARFAPIGSGLGTFQYVYHWYENPATVSSIYANHAHNDLLELLCETGIFGAAAVVVFLGWFLSSVRHLWREAVRRQSALATTIVIGAALLHSLADYPLRTAAISGIVAAACALVAAAARPQTIEDEDIPGD